VKKVDPIIDYEILRAYDAICFPDDYRIKPTAHETWWIDSNKGYCGLSPSSQYRDSVYLCRAGVLPTERGKGLQRHYIHVRCSHARVRGYKYVLTDCTPDNIASCNNLIRSGFLLYNPSRPWALSRSLYWYKSL